MSETASTSGGAASMTMHPAIAESWNLWAPIVGRTATTRLEQIWAEFPEMTSAIVATSDGLHICSLGLSPEDAGRIAALNSSMFAVARAESRIMAGAAESGGAAPAEDDLVHGHVGRTSVAISLGGIQTAVFSFVVDPFGQLLLGMSASGVQSGTLLVQTRNAALQVSLALGRDAPAL